MRIGLDITPLQTAHRMRGVGQYTRQLLREFAASSWEEEFHLFAYRGLPLDLPVLPANFRLHYLPHPTWSGRAAALISHQLFLPAALRRLRLGLFHAPFVSRDPSVPGMPFWQAVPGLVTLHDLTPLHFPEALLASPRKRLFYFRQLRAVCRAQHVLTDSEHSRQDIIDNLGIDPGKVTAIQLGVEVSDPPVPTQAPEHPYILHVGGDFFNKNVDTLLSAYRLLRERGNITHKLHLVGSYQNAQPGDGAGDFSSDVVRFTGLTHEEVVEQYRGASLFVFPSLYEGFGLPPLEAMSHGVPVIAARASSLPEVLGDAALFAEPQDVAGWADTIEAVITNPDLAARLRERGVCRARRFTWARTAEQTLRIYREQAEHLGEYNYARGV
jgi:glycosyltransferase involved in cell wall biosynthesis